MPYHVFGDEEFVEYLAVVDQKGVSHEVWNNGTGPGPGTDGVFVPCVLLLRYLLQELCVHVWSLLYGTSHCLFLPPADNKLVANGPSVACLSPLGKDTRARTGGAPSMGPSLPSTHGVGYRVLGDSTDTGSLPHVPPPTCLPIGHVNVVQVAQLTNRSPAILMHLAYLPRGEYHVGISTFPGKEGGYTPRRPDHLGAAPNLQLYVVYLHP